MCNLLIDWTWSTWFNGPKMKPLGAIVGSILLFNRFWWDDCYKCKFTRDKTVLLKYTH